MLHQSWACSSPEEQGHCWFFSLPLPLTLYQVTDFSVWCKLFQYKKLLPVHLYSTQLNQHLMLVRILCSVSYNRFPGLCANRKSILAWQCCSINLDSQTILFCQSLKLISLHIKSQFIWHRISIPGCLSVLCAVLWTSVPPLVFTAARWWMTLKMCLSDVISYLSSLIYYIPPFVSFVVFSLLPRTTVKFFHDYHFLHIHEPDPASLKKFLLTSEHTGTGLYGGSMCLACLMLQYYHLLIFSGSCLFWGFTLYQLCQ